MERILTIIKKLCLTISWGFFLSITLSFLIIALTINIQNDEIGYLNYGNEWWWPLVTMFSENPVYSILYWVSFLSLILGSILHEVIKWIFKE